MRQVVMLAAAPAVMGILDQYGVLAVFAFVVVENFAGATAWTLTFATLGYVLGRNWALIERIFTVLGYGGGALVAAAVIAYLVYRRRRAALSPAPADDTDADTSRDALTSGTSRS